MNDDRTYIPGTRRSTQQETVSRFLKIGMSISIVDVFDNVLRIKQDDKIVSEESDRINLKLAFGNQHGSSFVDP